MQCDWAPWLSASKWDRLLDGNFAVVQSCLKMHQTCCWISVPFTSFTGRLKGRNGKARPCIYAVRLPYRSHLWLDLCYRSKSSVAIECLIPIFATGYFHLQDIQVTYIPWGCVDQLVHVVHFSYRRIYCKLVCPSHRTSLQKHTLLQNSHNSE